MIIRHNLIVTTIIVLYTLLIIDEVLTENVDCKMIDKEKFKGG